MYEGSVETQPDTLLVIIIAIIMQHYREGEREEEEEKKYWGRVNYRTRIISMTCIFLMANTLIFYSFNLIYNAQE